MIKIPMKGGTIAHPVWTRFSAARVMLKPASHGTGVIAGGAVRAIMEAAGVTDVLAKTFGSRNPVNVSRAAIEGLSSLQDPTGARERRLAIARGES
jgi:small subunit ribosomal protein S5